MLSLVQLYIYIYICISDIKDFETSFFIDKKVDHAYLTVKTTTEKNGFTEATTLQHVFFLQGYATCTRRGAGCF